MIDKPVSVPVDRGEWIFKEGDPGDGWDGPDARRPTPRDLHILPAPHDQRGGLCSDDALDELADPLPTYVPPPRPGALPPDGGDHMGDPLPGDTFRPVELCPSAIFLDAASLPDVLRVSL